MRASIFWHLVSKKKISYRINEVCLLYYVFFQNLAVSNSNLKWVKLHFPTYEHGWKKICFWSSPFPESFWGSSLVSSWNLWNWNHSLLHTWPTPENFLCVFSNSWFCLWSLLHSSRVSFYTWLGSRTVFGLILPKLEKIFKVYKTDIFGVKIQIYFFVEKIKFSSSLLVFWDKKNM